MHWTLALAALVLGAWLYWWLAGVLITTTNQDPLAQDQKNNMRAALLARPTLKMDLSQGMAPAVRKWLPHQTDGVVAPLWPWVAAHIAPEDLTIAEETFAQNTPRELRFFQQGKWLNVALAGVFLGALGLWAAGRWTLLGTANFLLLAGLGALLPRAAAFQPEPLYYALFFLCWVVALRLCVRNALGWYVLFGLLCGLAALAKSSIQPLMAVWFGAMAVRMVISWWRPNERWSAARHVIGLAMWGTAFLLVLAPRLSFAQERWGRPFFEYPQVWAWMDDFTQGYAWMAQHPDKAALDAVPPGEMPSPLTYWNNHTPEQTWARLREGVEEKVGGFLWPKPAGKNAGTPEKPWKRLLEYRGAFLGGLLLIALVAVLLKRLQRGRLVPLPPQEHTEWPETFCRALFILGVLAASALLYGWYTPIGRGDRFMLSLWLPLVYSLFAWAEKSARPLPWGGARWGYAAAQAALLACLLWRVAEIVRQPHFQDKLP